MYTSLATVFTVSVLCETVFNIDISTKEVFNRDNVMFMSLFFNCIEALAELLSQMSGRSIMYKQHGFALFRPAAMTLAQLMADISFAFIRGSFFAITVWLLSLRGSKGSGSHCSCFFRPTRFVCRSDLHQLYVTSKLLKPAIVESFVDVFVSPDLATTSLSRVSGTTCKSFYVVAKVSALIIALLIDFSGYLVPPS